MSVLVVEGTYALRREIRSIVECQLSICITGGMQRRLVERVCDELLCCGVEDSKRSAATVTELLFHRTIMYEGAALDSDVNPQESLDVDICVNNSFDPFATLLDGTVYTLKSRHTVSTDIISSRVFGNIA